MMPGMRYTLAALALAVLSAWLLAAQNGFPGPGCQVTSTLGLGPKVVTTCAAGLLPVSPTQIGALGLLLAIGWLTRRRAG